MSHKAAWRLATVTLLSALTDDEQTRKGSLAETAQDICRQSSPNTSKVWHAIHCIPATAQGVLPSDRFLGAPVHGAALALPVAANELVQVEDEGRRAGAEVQLHLLVFAAGQQMLVQVIIRLITVWKAANPSRRLMIPAPEWCPCCHISRRFGACLPTKVGKRGWWCSLADRHLCSPTVGMSGSDVTFRNATPRCFPFFLRSGRFSRQRREIYIAGRARHVCGERVSKACSPPARTQAQQHCRGRSQADMARTSVPCIGLGIGTRPLQTYLLACKTARHALNGASDQGLTNVQLQPWGRKHVSMATEFCAAGCRVQART